MGLLAALFSKSEKRAYPPSWFAGLPFWGEASSSGVSVTEESALKYIAYYAAVDLLSNGVGQLPLITYRRLSDGGRERHSAHPLYELLHTRPNPEQTAFAFKKAMQAWILTWGNAYAEIERNKGGRPVALWPQPPNMIEVKRDTRGRLIYVHGDRRDNPILAENMLHIHTLGDGLVGYSPVRLFREAIGLGLAAEQFGAAFFGNSAKPSGTITHPETLTPEALTNLRNSIESTHGGSANAGRTLILQEGMAWTQIGIPPDDAQFLQTRQFQVTDIARIFHIAPHKLQDLVRATFSNIEHQSIEYVQDGLGPWLVNWEQECTYRLLFEAERKSMYCEFLVDALLRGDAKGRGEYYRVLWNIGAMSQNEIRQRENMNPVEGGDQYFVPQNMIPADKVAEMLEKQQQPPEPPAEGPAEEQDEESDRMAGIAAAHRPLLADLCERVVHKETNALRKALKHPETFPEVAGEFYERHAAHIREVIGPAVRAVHGSVGAPPMDLDQYIIDLAEAMSGAGTVQFLGAKRAPAELDKRALNTAKWPDKILRDMVKHATAKPK